MAPQLECLLSVVKVWPGFLVVLAHEHDVRGALSAPAGRDSYEMEAASEWLLSSWRPAEAVLVRIGEKEIALGPETEPHLTLKTSAFESFRFRLGRRSPAQLRAMDWSGDPGRVLDKICIFGPEPYDIIE